MATLIEEVRRRDRETEGRREGTESDSLRLSVSPSLRPDSCSLRRDSNPRAAYIHVPFCRHRCGYCNFTLVAGRDDLIDAYLEALERELAHLGQPHEVDTLFFGGGTPTHLPPQQLKTLFAIVRQCFPLATGGEFSVETNPI